MHGSQHGDGTVKGKERRKGGRMARANEKMVKWARHAKDNASLPVNKLRRRLEKINKHAVSLQVGAFACIQLRVASRGAAPG